MAANLGERSLADVHQEGLDEILSGLAHIYPGHSSHDTHSLGVPLLDTLLEVFAPKAPAAGAVNDGQPQPPNEAVEKQTIEDDEMLLHSEFPAGQAYRPDEIHTAQDIDPSANVLFSESDGSKKRQVPIVEISSSLSSSGKSQLLYYLTALAILPRKWGDISVSGQEAAVVFIDTDDRFDAERLRTVARGIVQQQRGLSESRLGVQAQPGGMPDHHLESLLVSSLQHVHVFRPQSSSALLATVHKLDSYLFDLTRHRSASRPLQMIAIDSATAFFWQDRLRDEVARTEEIGRPQVEIDSEREQKRRFHLSDLYTELARELKGLQSQFQCAVVYTATVSGGRASVPAQYDQPQARVPSLRPALPAPWGNFPTLRLIVHRSSVRPFPPSMPAHAAVKDAPSRQSVVQQGKISAWVNPWGCDGWPRRIVEALEANNDGSFSFYVRDSGVGMTDPHH
ncbi:unnamed protein product [Penicillium nalgiovense]|uniref:DNA recombination and repair protein Rad51-like C-terminal domain-containing protein n=1 Tax=Penicillium nalgiovense TaxID=60175 RepID=A0A9W4HI91_PENNA|nr:unnamed protein product [Penicillium nalgiovense]CAG7948719.1 unnamed protein product [Penicillium nalgiovense]CAG7957616.1 unnamed protein product [Penicillium nalgiovense]CAG7976420.1 unnamed protein product [Penicillium nalgiovense]CAG7989622.1 unnamed protein product [Penicillium nalgiovense]